MNRIRNLVAGGPRRRSTSLALGLALLVMAVVLPWRSTVLLPWFVPTADLLAASGLVVVTVLACLDATLREDSRSLPLALVGSALSVVWVAHAVVFPGTIPDHGSQVSNDMASWLYLLLNLATPLLLILLALTSSHPVPPGRMPSVMTVLRGVTLGVAIIAAGWLLGVSTITSVSGNTFTALDQVVGGVGALIGLAALWMVLADPRRERAVNGLVAALVFTIVNSVVLTALTSRYTPTWYVVHLMPLLTVAALVAGALGLYARSVRAELAAVRRLAVSYEVAQAVATSLELGTVAEQLAEQALATIDADRASFHRIEDDRPIVEAVRAIDGGAPASGTTSPLEEAALITAAVQSHRVEVLSIPKGWETSPEGLTGADHTGVTVRHAMAAPLLVDGSVVGVLTVLRARDEPFGGADVGTAQVVASAAALAIRNARRYANLEDVSEAKSLFLNLAAHELRTPLTVIRGYHSMMADGSLGDVPELWSSVIAVLQAKSNQLSELVEGILAAARIELESMQDRRQLVDLKEASVEAVGRLQPAVSLREGDVEVELPDGPACVAADPGHLARVLDILLTNALTYTKGRPWVRIRVDTVPGHVRVTVEDHGVGVRPEDRERIFDRLVRVDHPELGFPAGTGLGLYLARTLVDRMGGTLQLEHSRPGEGSRFVIELPLTATIAEAVPEAEPEAELESDPPRPAPPPAQVEAAADTHGRGPTPARPAVR